MKLWEIYRFEVQYQLRQATVWLYLVVLLLFTFIMDLITSPNDGVYDNNTFHITAATVIGGFIWLIMAASIAGQAAARDVQVRMHPLIYTAPLSKSNFLYGRFLAAFSINAVLVLSLPLGIMLSFHMPGTNHDSMGPFHIWPYISVFLLIALPNAFVATALQFALAVRRRSAMAAYMASLLLAFLAQVVAVAAANLFGNWDFAKLLDPVGIAGIAAGELNTWSAAEKNTRLITLEGMFLWNRILWIFIAALACLTAWRQFNFNEPKRSSWLRRFKMQKGATVEIAANEVMVAAAGLTVPQVRQNFGFATRCVQVWSVAWQSFRKIAGNPVGLAVVVAIGVVSVVFAGEIITQFGIPLYPTTTQVLDYLAVPMGNIGKPWVVIPLLIMYFSGELIWSERDSGMGDISDTIPLNEWTFLVGKLSGLAMIVVVWMALLMLAGIMMQMSLGYDKLELGLYFQVLFGIKLIDYLHFAVLAIVVHTIVNQKIIGFLVLLLVFIYMAFPSTFGINHNMLVFGAAPEWSYTDMRGFAATLGPWLWFKAYWTAWSLLLAVLGRLFWVRGKENGFKCRLFRAKKRLTVSTRQIAFVASGVVIIVGLFIFYNTNILNDYVAASSIGERKAGYEKHYGQYRDSLQPVLTGTKLNVEIYPRLQQAEIDATYILVNKETTPISAIHLTNVPGIAPTAVKFNRPFTTIIADNLFSFHIYKLSDPLMPGDSIQLSFNVKFIQRGFTNDGKSVMVSKNGTYIKNYEMLPLIGYQPHAEINDPLLRKQHGLAARPAIPSLYDADARKKPATRDRNIFEAVIGTDAGEVAVAPGKLQQTWKKGNRRYFHYKTNAHLRGEYTILSGSYAVLESDWNGIAIRIYYNPEHVEGVRRMLRSVKASMEYFTAEFGPYPFSHFTLVARAGGGEGASSAASMVEYGEKFALMNPDDSAQGFDLPYYIIAHEVAHQWFGGAQLRPADVEGAGVLIEGLAVYGGIQVLEKNYNRGHLQRYVDFLHSFYEMPRNMATHSLLEADESFLYYRKGGLAMYALSEYIGKSKVNGALRGLLEKHRSGNIQFPTTLDLYREIQKVTPDSLNYLLDDLFKKNTYWQMKAKQLKAEKITTGQWKVTLKVDANKFTVDNRGNRKTMPMDDWMEIGFYEEGKTVFQPIYLKMHRIRSGEQIIQVTMSKKPARGGIDPRGLMVDIRTDDNTTGLSID